MPSFGAVRDQPELPSPHPGRGCAACRSLRPARRDQRVDDQPAGHGSASLPLWFHAAAGRPALPGRVRHVLTATRPSTRRATRPFTRRAPTSAELRHRKPLMAASDADVRRSRPPQTVTATGTTLDAAISSSLGLRKNTYIASSLPGRRRWRPSPARGADANPRPDRRVPVDPWRNWTFTKNIPKKPIENSVAGHGQGATDRLHDPRCDQYFDRR